MDWFQSQFGFREQTGSKKAMLKTREEFRLNGTRLTSKRRPDRVFEAGRFRTPSLEELRLNMEMVRRSDLQAVSGRLSVREVVGDASALHAVPENEYALFQAASQFNCLEHTSERGLPEHGITCYAFDRTQGPACATTCGPGTVVRNYFPYGAEGPPQCGEEQIQNLELVEEALDNQGNKYFQVKSGYTLSSESKLRQLGAAVASPAAKENVMNRLRIGIQEDTEVTATNFGSCVFEPPEEGKRHLVTQAYCSACSVSYSRCSEKAWEPFATLVLRASYEATMHAALENALRHPRKPGARRVFLTAVGGGVFGNPMSWVEDAMRRAFEKFRDYDLQVFLVSYGCRTREFGRLAAEFPVMEAAVPEAPPATGEASPKLMASDDSETQAEEMDA